MNKLRSFIYYGCLIVVLHGWVQGGETVPAAPREHWAFQKAVRPPLPHIQRAKWAHNPIDAFLATQQEERQLVPLEPAPKRLLLRRLYLDLIGIPPTREELHAYDKDESADAFDKVVQDLLSRPQYGERWGRHWMDIWRYSDWFGLGKQLRNSQKHLWHWRDWIIQSLNEDKGYDRMILEMLAADELYPKDRDALAATGFLARHYYLFNRTTWLDDTIEHTSKAFLGLTMNCAKCHDHKYDPITQVDYYSFRAFFEPYQVRLDAVPGETDLEKDGLPRIFETKPDATTYLHIQGDEKNPDTNEIIQPALPEVLASGDLGIYPVNLPPEAHTPALLPYVLEDQLEKADQSIESAQSALTNAQKAFEEFQVKSANDSSKTPVKAVAREPIFLEDSFAQAAPDIWEMSPGQWEYTEGKLVQSRTGASRAYLRSRAQHPRDFEAELRFKTLGGDKWRSVGLCFDVGGAMEKLVYMSAVSPGSKLQISYDEGNGPIYPSKSSVPRKVETGQTYTLKVMVRDKLVNVAVDGQHTLAYQLPVDRQPGRIDLIAFDAVVEFHSLEIRPLANHVSLVQAGDEPSGITLEESRMEVTVAKKTLALAKLRPEVLRHSRAALMASAQKADNCQELIQAAARVTRRYKVAQAEQKVAIAEKELALTEDSKKSGAEKKFNAAQETLEKTRANLEKPGNQFERIRASLKALEGPDEKEDSRLKPYPTTSSGRRTALACWLTDRNNPLTARVAVNHIWLRHFGQPLVESVTDFGRRAPKPPQHALLDWLAVEFMEHNWSMKHLHQLMVTSQAYRLSSSTLQANQATRQTDPNNEYYWRRQPIRMESQVIRDSLLHMANLLNPTMGGPPIQPNKNETAYRRSLYFKHSRDDQDQFLSMFDDADILRCYRRSESVIPQQALAMANSKLALDMSRRITNRLQEEIAEQSDDTFIQAAFETILSLRPTAEEQEACLKALNDTRATLSIQDTGKTNLRARENLVHALLNHNDFVTIR